MRKHNKDKTYTGDLLQRYAFRTSPLLFTFGVTKSTVLNVHESNIPQLECNCTLGLFLAQRPALKQCERYITSSEL